MENKALKKMVLVYWKLYLWKQTLCVVVKKAKLILAYFHRNNKNLAASVLLLSLTFVERET